MRPRLGRSLLAFSLLLGPIAGQCVQQQNACLEFDGVNDWARVPNPGPNVIDGFSDFTVEAWFRSIPPANYLDICGKYEYATGGYLLRQSPGGGLQFLLQPGTPSTAVALTAGAGLDNGQWHHAAAARIGSAVTLYADGVVIASANSSTPLPSNATDFTIATHFTSGVTGGYPKGSIDEVRVWNVGHTSAQINNSMSLSLSGIDAGLRGYWRLDDGAGQTIVNSASLTGASTNGFRGSQNVPMSDDPAWSFVSAPITNCSSGLGQPNSAAASLRVNGIGAPGKNGPFQVAIPQSGASANVLTLTWQGPPAAPLILLGGGQQTNSYALPCVGSLDLSLVSLTVIGGFNTSPFPLNLLFWLDNSGFAQTSFTIPSQLLGSPFLNIQGLVENPNCAGVGYALTACFTIQ